MMMNKTLFLTLLAVVSLARPALAAEPAYLINPGDRLVVYVRNEEPKEDPTVIVSPDGFISYPLAGQIPAAGLTALQLEQKLSDALGKYIKDKPVVTVQILEVLGNKIFVLGKVNRPGEFPMNRPTDVMQALAMGGGLNAFASEGSIVVLRRQADGSQTAIPFDYSDVADGEALESNILLQGGDVVVVQ